MIKTEGMIIITPWPHALVQLSISHNFGEQESGEKDLVLIKPQSPNHTSIIPQTATSQSLSDRRVVS